jgi:hypothetical protein
MTTMPNDLKPCPFCGTELVWDDEFQGHRHIDNDCYLAGADSEYARICVLNNEIDVWNRRDDK